MIRRGEIWWANLPSPRRSEPGFRRPVVIVSSDAFNRSTIRTVLAAVITSNMRLAEAPGNVALTRKQSKLSQPSVINVSQIITLDKDFLVEKVGRLPPKQLRALESGLRLVFSL